MEAEKMKKVVVQCDDAVRCYDNVTKVQFFGAGDFFKSYFAIFQGKEKTVIMMTEIIGFEIKEDIKEEEMTEKMYEELKKAVWESGLEAIEELLGYEINAEEDSDVKENRMDIVLEQMPEKAALSLYKKYCGKTN